MIAGEWDSRIEEAQAVDGIKKRKEKEYQIEERQIQSVIPNPQIVKHYNESIETQKIHMNYTI